jgi:hypothetical protein
MKFKHIYWMQPIDWWERAELADSIIAEAVLNQMPESPRSGEVYKMTIPDPPCIGEMYLCKADNNGTTYIFTNIDLAHLFNDIIEY